MLRDSTSRFVGPLVGPSVGHILLFWGFLGFLFTHYGKIFKIFFYLQLENIFLSYVKARIFQELLYYMNEFGLKNTEKNDILPFFGFFFAFNCTISKKKISVKGENMYILANAKHF